MTTPWTAPWSVPSLDVPPSYAYRVPVDPHEPAPAPPARAGAPASRTGGLREALADRDRDVGLGRGGPLVAAARDAAYDAPLPNESSATIRVALDADGRVTDAAVLAATSGADAWRDVARAIADAVAKRPLTLPAGARGRIITLRVDAKVRLPSGAAPSAPVTPYSQVGTLGRPAPCRDSIQSGVQFDVSDVGANARKVVSARVLEEREP